jgi:glycosyltransferase involved in cell wall biosynthesis
MCLVRVMSDFRILIQSTLPYIKPVRLIYRATRRRINILGNLKWAESVHDAQPTKGDTILWLDEYCPMGRHDAGSVRARLLIENFLHRGYTVLLKTHDSQCSMASHRHPEGVISTKRLGKLGKLFAPKLVWISRLSVFLDYFDEISSRFPSAKLLWDSVDLQSKRLLSESKVDNSFWLGKLASYVERMELKAAKLAFLNVTASTSEANWLSNVSALKPLVISTIHEDRNLPGAPEKTKGMVFVANFSHAPNAAGLEWFINEVWPLLSPKAKEEGLSVVGANPPIRLVNSNELNIKFLGFVGDLAPVLSTAKVNIAPLITGAGAKGKISEAAQFGLVTVTTSVGADGMNFKDDESIFVADLPKMFAERIESAMENETLRRNVGRNARLVFEKHHSKKMLTKKVDQIIDSLRF